MSGLFRVGDFVVLRNLQGTKLARFEDVSGEIVGSRRWQLMLNIHTQREAFCPVYEVLFDITRKKHIVPEEHLAIAGDSDRPSSWARGPWKPNLPGMRNAEQKRQQLHVDRFRLSLEHKQKDNKP